METKRAEMFQGLDLDQILFAKKRQKKEEERIAQVKRLEERKIKEKKLKTIKKKKKKEEYEKKVQEKWEKATPEESEYREACKAVARGTEVWEEAEQDGSSKEECVRLRRRLQQAEQDREEGELDKDYFFIKFSFPFSFFFFRRLCDWKRAFAAVSVVCLFVAFLLLLLLVLFSSPCKFRDSVEKTRGG